MTENKRLKELQTKLGFKTQRAFAADLGIKDKSLYEIYTSRKNIGVSNHIKKLLALKYGISTQWLETGAGGMFKEYGDNSHNENNIIGNSNVITGTGIDNRKYYSESPDVLRAQIDEKDTLLREKDEYIKELKEIIKELKAKETKNNQKLKQKINIKTP
jgi:hypothetical protein